MMAKQFRRAAVLTTALLSINTFAAETVAIPDVKMDPALHAKLPAEIQKSGVLTSVNNGSFPPYEIVTGTNSLDGASADLAHSMGQLLGVKIEHASVSGLSGILTGISSGRYQMGIGPIGDYPERQAKNDFVDFVKEYVAFAVPNGNPKNIQSLADTCGLRIAVMAAGSAEKVIKQQSEDCVKAGKEAITVQSFTDQPTSILAVRSKRSDAFFSSQAPLSYFIKESNGQLTLAGAGKSNGFNDIFQGTVVPKDSEIGKVVLAAYQELFTNGTYAAIMKKWGLEGNMLQAPGINLGKPTK
ncbi:amino acid ABC transporter [Rouxiella silvae]|uniref:ABC transporter substrate-binding protein n=1 Tax=Rouxiella silvae TaxID=1646373 RepID=A0AA40WYJ2_9GAMM|nr:ABC transporter substrate-binding protein [Rouxiella silvae]KQN47536.1 amino acid ABC transporter [Serratia sp. Leaf50]MBF6635346.1 ABC transporter substrate-binding protein [Rouxiella silvae]ORJ21388.1 amino acid ABC transporter [Rouxiella silvae]